MSVVNPKPLVTTAIANGIADAAAITAESDATLLTEHVSEQMPGHVPEHVSEQMAVHLLFVPDWANPRFFMWGSAAGESPLSVLGDPGVVTLADEALQVREVAGYTLPLLAAIRALAKVTAHELMQLSPSVAVWSLAAKLLLDLMARERCVPRVIGAEKNTHAPTTQAPMSAEQSTAQSEARWSVALSLLDDAERVAQLAKSFPLAAHSLPLSGSMTQQLQQLNRQLKKKARATRSVDTRRANIGTAIKIWSAEALLHSFLDMSADALLREASSTLPVSTLRVSRKRKTHKKSETHETATHDATAHTAVAHTAIMQAQWPARFVAALTQPTTDKECARFVPHGFAERGVLNELAAWVQPAFGASAHLPRLCLRFDVPDEAKQNATLPNGRPAPELFELRYFLQASDNVCALVPAADVFSQASSVNTLHTTSRIAEEQLLKSLVAAGRIFAPIELSLRQARPESVQLKADAAWSFIKDAAPAIVEAGMSVILPAALTRNGQRRLRMRMHIGQRAAANKADGASTSTLSDALLHFRWEAELDGQLLNQDDLAELAKLKAPLVRYRGQWVAVDQAELAHAQHLLTKGGGNLTRAAALAAALGGAKATTDTITGNATASGKSPSTLPVEVAVEGELKNLLTELNDNTTHTAFDTPRELHGELRPYQQRGVAWLAMMSRLQLGACLADDMGLGKTIQLLAYLLHRREQTPQDGKPILLVCPTSVLGNWQREIARFAPSIPVYPHYGPDRARHADALRELAPGCIVMTSFGLLRRDAQLLNEVEWSVAVLDEAQNIKNASSRTARTARTLNADFRVALTGTPVENRLTELWSISEFLNPGMLGSFEGFRREIAIPIERFAREDVAERLKQIVRPLILRRVKSDPNIIQDLPPKQEMTVYCTLTREQASLYQAALDEALQTIEGADGIERRGHVLALITALKQICNHPAQYLHEAGPLGGRSGKLERLREMLDETIATGDRVLVFTQYREMGARLVRELSRHFGNTIQYLHGGTPRAARDAMIARFQEDCNGPSIFVLSLKAGGTGLNLTAATHVFHYDRWWNPAVEDQATDRAYRIGQQRKVQVHKFLCAGTIEERVNQMLESKRDLAARIVGQGEQWITELDNEQLRDLFSLSPNAVIGSDETDDDGELVARPRRKPVKRRSRRKEHAATALDVAGEIP